MRLLVAELRKLVTLPSVWVAGAVGLVAPAVIAVIAARQGAQVGIAPGPDEGFQELATVGVVAAIVVGVVAVSSEYGAEDAEAGGGRPIATTLWVTPRRIALLVAKLGAVGVVVAALAAISAAVTLSVTAMAGDAPTRVWEAGEVARAGGVIAFWVLTAWLALGLTVMTRSGVAPMAVLILNTSLVSVSYLLSRVWYLANYLPDRAGYGMFIVEQPSAVHIAPLVGGLVMLAWTAAAVATAVVVLHRRDA